MGLKKWHGTAGMVTNDTKMGWNCDSNRQKHNANSDMASSSIRKTTGFKIQTRDIRNPFKRPRYPSFEQLGPILFSPPPTKTQKRLLVHHVKTRTANAHPPNHTLLGGTCLFRPKEGSVPIPLPPWVRNARTTLLRAAYAFQVTWSERGFSWPFVSDMSPKMHWPRRPGKTPYKE